MSLDEGRRYVQKMRAEGRSDEDIVGFLTAAGWGQSDIDHLMAGDHKPLAPAPPPPHDPATPARPASGVGSATAAHPRPSPDRRLANLLEGLLTPGPLRTRALAWVWLGLAGAEILLCAWYVEGVARYGTHEMEVGIAAYALILVAVIWAAPLAVGCVALLRGRPYGWSIVLVFACLGCLLWTLAIVFLSVVALAIAVFSGLTVWWLLRDPPSGWTRPASR